MANMTFSPSAAAFDDLMDRIELSRDVEISRREFAEGKGIPHNEAMRQIDEHIKSLCAKRSAAI